ncbi:MAG: GGDEF domain-containing protein, partial [Candidatus Limnocylindrales bacterium]
SAGGSERPIEGVTSRNFLVAALLASVSLALLHAAVYLAFGVASSAVAACLIFGYVVMLAAGWIVIERGRLGLAMLLAAAGLLAVAVGLAAFVPTATGLVVLAPVVAVALAMTYVSRQRLGKLAVATWLAGLGIVVLGELIPNVGASAPAAVSAALRIAQTAVGLGFAIFLLWEFSRRLDVAMVRMTVSNAAISEAQDTVKRVNRELRRQVHELELRNREATLVGHLGSLLEVSQTADEAYGVIERGARLLFPGLSGALFMLPPNRLVVERVATWGVLQSQSRIYRPEDCWALRQGRLYIVDGPDPAPRCGHIPADAPAVRYMCIPMTAQGATLGIFHLSEGAPDELRLPADRSSATPVTSSPGQPQTSTAGAFPAEAPQTASRGERRAEARQADIHLTESARNLGLWVAELLALSLANFRLRETLHAQSTRDPLTGLFNRRYMEDSLERELYRAGREEGSLGVIMADIDHFKAFNDRSGHVAGDAVLRALAQLLAASVRSEDIVCRFGGEEFTILLPNATLDETTIRAEALRVAAADLVTPDGQPVTLSMGVAAFPDHGVAADALIQAADAAMYQAKAGGRNRVTRAA